MSAADAVRTRRKYKVKNKFDYKSYIGEIIKANKKIVERIMQDYLWEYTKLTSFKIINCPVSLIPSSLRKSDEKVYAVNTIIFGELSGSITTIVNKEYADDIIKKVYGINSDILTTNFINSFGKNFGNVFLENICKYIKIQSSCGAPVAVYNMLGAIIDTMLYRYINYDISYSITFMFDDKDEKFGITLVYVPGVTDTSFIRSKLY